ncbi:MAG: thermonuclease family protein [Alteraurantiacibacter sp.]
MATFTAVFVWGGGPVGLARVLPDNDAARGSGMVVDTHFPRCDDGMRITCIVDGDTIWYQGEKIRIADIDTPEVGDPGCANERSMGNRAMNRMQVLLNEGEFTLSRPFGTPDRDQYDRLLRTVERDGESVGAMLVNEGLAEKWGGRRIAWC